MLQFIIGLVILVLVGVITDKDIKNSVFEIGAILLLAYVVGVLAMILWEILTGKYC